MAKAFLIFFLSLSLHSHAQLLETGSAKREDGLPELTEKIRKLVLKDDPAYEESFNQVVKEIEDKVEAEKLYCSGEAQNEKGELLPPAQKQLCMRELKKHYLEATSTIFDVKKKYLGLIHQRQLEKLTDIQKKLKTDIEKNF